MTSRRTPRGGLRVALLALFAIVVGACAPQHLATNDKVLLVGDSIFNGSRTQLQDVLSSAGWQPTVQADGGTTIGFWVDKIPLLETAQQPGVIVIELGTNDCGFDVPCASLQPVIDRIMFSIPSNQPVLWLNTQEDVPDPFSQHRDFVNNELEAADARYSNFYLIDFDDFFEGHPEWHLPDGLHPNDVGRQELAEFVAAELERFKAS